MARKVKRKTGWFWASALLFGVGYLATRLMIAWWPAQTPAVTTGILVALTIPFATRARRLLSGALRGLGLGLAGSLGLAAAVLGPGQGINPVTTTLISVSAAVIMICCTVAGGIFAYLAERRRRKLEAGALRRRH